MYLIDEHDLVKKHAKISYITSDLNLCLICFGRALLNLTQQVNNETIAAYPVQKCWNLNPSNCIVFYSYTVFFSKEIFKQKKNFFLLFSGRTEVVLWPQMDKQGRDAKMNI